MTSLTSKDRLSDLGAKLSPSADLSPSVAARHACRAGMATTTAGIANGFVQGNLAILPEKLAASFHRFCQLNPKPCPVIGMSDVGDFRIPSLGIDLDIRTDLPRYRVWRDGEVVEEPTDIMAHWRNDLVAFVLGCSFSFEEALMADDLPIRHIERNVRVPMYRTSIACAPSGPFAGPMVVSMRPFKPADAIRAVQITSRFPAVHGAPVHLGHPHSIGIADIAKPDYACGSRRDPRVLGLRRHPASGDRGGEIAVRDHARAGIDAGDGPEEQAACRALMQVLPPIEALP
jgi:uncharacterized protein YcsI (UPF0317 family)